MRRYRVYSHGKMLARYDDESCALLLAMQVHGAVYDVMLRKIVYSYKP